MAHTEVITLLVGSAVILGITLIGMHDRKRRKRDGTVLSGMVGAFDEVFHPEGARAAEIREVQQKLPAENPAPEDPLLTIRGDSREVDQNRPRA